MANEDKPRPDISAGMKALLGPIPKPVVYPTVIRFVYGCKGDLCLKAFPIEEGFKVRTAMSEEHAQELISEFSKTVIEPRTIKCSCGHEDEYFQNDVRAYPLEPD
jgi:hypothetical protein